MDLPPLPSPPMLRSTLLALVVAAPLAPFSAPLHAQDQFEVEPNLTWSDIVSGESQLKFYGFVRLDTIFDDARLSDPMGPVFVRSADDANASQSEFTMHSRLTRIGMLLDGPTVPGLGDAKLSGRVEFDFQGGGSDSRPVPRLRRAFGQLEWEHTSLLLGQEWDFVSPLAPAVNNDTLLWGAGNTGDRHPQVRLRNERDLWNGTLRIDMGFLLAGAVENTNVLQGLSSGEASGRPMLAARMGYRCLCDLEFGVWGHEARERFDPDGGGPLGEADFSSRALGFDVRAPLADGDWWLKAEGFFGTNLDDLRGGVLQGVNAAGEEIDSKGGWFEVGTKLDEHFTLSVGTSVDDPEDDRLVTGGRARNGTTYLGLAWQEDSLRAGFEVIDWNTEFIDQADGEALRVAFWVAYTF